MTNKQVSDDDRLVRQHEASEANVEHNLSSEVSLQAEVEAHRDAEAIDRMAQQTKDKAVAEVAEAARISGRRRGLARTVQVIDFLFGVVYVLLAVRLVLGLIGANPSSGFVKFVAQLTDPFYAFFRGILPSPTASGGHTVALPVLVAMGAYALLHWGVRSLAKLVAYRRSEI